MTAYARPKRRLLDRATSPAMSRAPLRTVAQAVPVHVIDTGLSNLDSMIRALELCGGRPVLVQSPAALAAADHIVLPGVGAFAASMERLEESGLAEAIRSAAHANRKILGVCLGMQLLAKTGSEGGVRPGLGLIAGEVIALQPSGRQERLPHNGWNAVDHDGDCPLLADVAPGTDFYFVHGYRFVPADAAHIVARTPYCGGFASVVRQGSVFGAQFHPEKSQKPGFALLRAFLKLA